MKRYSIMITGNIAGQQFDNFVIDSVMAKNEMAALTKAKKIYKSTGILTVKLSD